MNEDRRLERARAGDAAHAREQEPPPSTQNLAQWGWFSFTSARASARVRPISRPVS